MNARKYCEYFDIDRADPPCIDQSALNAGVDWKITYPHETFIRLLKAIESMLGGTPRSIWIHGAYGTGKSRCAYTLKKILEVSEDELRSYWNMYEPFKREEILLNKLLGHKEKGIITAFRYASGTINSPQQLFLAVQESIKQALDEQGVAYKGERTLKESVIAWLSQPAQNAFVNTLLNKPEWESLFAQSTADEIINSLRKSSDVSHLMDNIFRMAAKEGITALSLDAEKLRDWIKDIINTNNTKIVLVWDEFSDFFKINRNSLGEFQKIVSICEEAPFYFIIVTHPFSSIALGEKDEESWKVVQQRFERIEIELPENIAFDLIAHSFRPTESAKGEWEHAAIELEKKIPNAINHTIKAASIKDTSVLRRILPIHPLAALVLKNIASGFQSNQRSMFDFIKSPLDSDIYAFQGFINEHTPLDDQPLLTVDMLWDFFYVKGKDYLSRDIRLVLDTFQQQTSLREDEKKVLKAVLIMQAIDQRLGGMSAVKPTEQIISYAFEGIEGYEDRAKNIAKGLEAKKILIGTPIGDGRKSYGAAVLAGDNAKIEASKTEIRKKSTTSNLVLEGDMLPTALSLTPALKLRYAKDDSGALPVVTVSDFTKTMDALKNKDAAWRFYSVLAVAKDEDEAQNFRALIKRTIANEEYKNIVVIDALSSPLGVELFEQYVDYSAMAMYYQGNNNQQAKENSNKAKSILNRTWKDKIHDGQFYVFTFANQDGERAIGANNVHVILQTSVLNKFRHVFDFTKGLTETQLKLTTAKQVSRYGMGGLDINGLIRGCEKSVLGLVWGREKYWEVSELQTTHIVVIKQAVDKLIEAAFAERGQISIGEIYDYLQDEFGFSPCNLSAFVTGFLLKEYNSDPYRCIDAEGYPDTMTPDKLAEMIGNYIGKSPKPTCIVKMTPAEKTFYEATEKAWMVPATTCSSPSQVATQLGSKMQSFGYPTWSLEYVDDSGIYDIVKKYIALVRSDGKDTHNIAIEIGDIFMHKPTLIEGLKVLLTADKCREGMTIFLEQYREGKLMSLAEEIGAKDIVLSDVRKLFSVKHSAMWVEDTGKTEIDKLIVEYDVIKQTNGILNVVCNTKEKAFDAWREVLKFVGFSCDALKSKRPNLDKLLSYLLKIMNREDMLPEMMKEFLSELNAHRSEMCEILNNKLSVFEELYGAYLENFSITEKEEIQNSINKEIFTATTTASNQTVKQAAETYRKNQIKTQLFNQWKALTGTKNPREWSSRYGTPILCLVDVAHYAEAKLAFTTLNNTYQTDSDIHKALEFLAKSESFFDMIQDSSKRDEAFMQVVVGSYAVLLSDPNAVRQVLESLPVDVYDWYDSPIVKQKIQQMADAEYYAGGSDKAVGLIDKMSDSELKKRLIELVQKDIELGIKIISAEDK